MRHFYYKMALHSVRRAKRKNVGCLMERKNLENTLSELVHVLKPAPFPSANATEHWSVELDGTEETNSRWRTYMSAALKTAKTFEIHCWKEETECIGLALRYGKRKDADWRHGEIIAGDVTPEFISLLLGLPKPTDTEPCNKMTPFFTIALDNCFWSEHYGTELSGTAGPT